MTRNLSPHHRHIEAESISIIYEGASEFCHQVMLYSISKDPGVMLHPDRKAFQPGRNA